MNDRQTVSGRWVVLVLLALGVIAGIVGVKYRKLAERPAPQPAPSTTTRSIPR